MSKETYYRGKRDLPHIPRVPSSAEAGQTCQKRPTIEAKETYYTYRGCHPLRRQRQIHQQPVPQPLPELLSPPPGPPQPRQSRESLSQPRCSHSPTLPELPPPPSPPWAACGQARQHFVRNHYLGAHAHTHWREVHDTMAMRVAARAATSMAERALTGTRSSLS